MLFWYLRFILVTGRRNQTVLPILFTASLKQSETQTGQGIPIDLDKYNRKNEACRL